MVDGGEGEEGEGEGVVVAGGDEEGGGAAGGKGVGWSEGDEGEGFDCGLVDADAIGW